MIVKSNTKDIVAVTSAPQHASAVPFNPEKAHEQRRLASKFSFRERTAHSTPQKYFDLSYNLPLHRADRSLYRMRMHHT